MTIRFIYHKLLIAFWRNGESRLPNVKKSNQATISSLYLTQSICLTPDHISAFEPFRLSKGFKLKVVIAETFAFFEAKDKSFLKNVVMYEKHWNCCITLDVNKSRIKKIYIFCWLPTDCFFFSNENIIMLLFVQFCFSPQIQSSNQPMSHWQRSSRTHSCPPS